MSVPLKIVGYDKETERLAIEHDVPPAITAEARRLASVQANDDGLGAYPLEPSAAIALGARLQHALNPDRYDWFLEPR